MKKWSGSRVVDSFSEVMQTEDLDKICIFFQLPIFFSGFWYLAIEDRLLL